MKLIICLDLNGSILYRSVWEVEYVQDVHRKDKSTQRNSSDFNANFHHFTLCHLECILFSGVFFSSIFFFAQCDTSSWSVHFYLCSIESAYISEPLRLTSIFYGTLTGITWNERSNRKKWQLQLNTVEHVCLWWNITDNNQQHLYIQHLFVVAYERYIFILRSSSQFRRIWPNQTWSTCRKSGILRRILFLCWHS